MSCARPRKAPSCWATARRTWVSTSPPRCRLLKHIAARNIQVFPRLRDANIVRTWAALRVMSPDGFPIYEQSERYPGAFAATCHSGVTLAGAHALALAPAILDGVLTEALASFSASRFAAATA